MCYPPTDPRTDAPGACVPMAQQKIAEGRTLCQTGKKENNEVMLIRPMAMENAMLPKKGLIFKDTRHKISVPLAMSTNL